MITSPLPLALIVVLLVPVVIVMPPSLASAAFTVRLPLSETALILATRLFTTWLAPPERVMLAFSACRAAFTTKVALLPLMLVAPVPVVMLAEPSEAQP